MKKYTNIVRRKTFNNFSITLEISSDHSSTSVLSKIKIIQVQCFFSILDGLMLTFLTGLLTGHPARKYVVDFIRTIVVDSFSHHVSSKSSITLDVVLDVSLKIRRIHLSIIKRKNNECTLNE